ncbi:MAG: class I SAM-dependent methyltransferase [Alphaproteobacteria bacterium]|nr:class I SAM-dependent methyltransferase [Alphaproteobacteria bacterium]MDE2496157.1 class I SAM-dependent methyltransferase [Alphaproteobacteria bacterium]
MNQTATLYKLRRTVSTIPVLSDGAKAIYRFIASAQQSDAFRSSPEYWETRYTKGGNSGAGSYGRLSQYKADIINNFVVEHGVESVIEFGCGDGAQLQLANYSKYTGVDVSWQALDICQEKFKDDKTKRFVHLSAAARRSERADLVLSLDVIYHLVEDEVFFDYMNRLVSSAERYICIYSSDVDAPGPAPHIRHRYFTDWMTRVAPAWNLIQQLPNIYPYDPLNPNETSWSDFFFYSRCG